MEKKKNTPKLRFPEFTGEWEEKKLGEIVISLDSGVSVNSVNEAIKEESEYGILKTSCIISGMFYPDENKRIIDDEVSRARLNPCADSILISRMNTPLLVGESGYVSSNYSNLYIPDRLWMAKINHETTNSRLLSIILSSKKIKDKITNIATGTSGSMKNISKPNFLNLEIRIPTLLEQTKLATFLTAVDEKLTQLKKKKTLLEQYKKGVMQKLFSQELRFKDDNNQDFPDWQEKTLGDVASIRSGLSKNQNGNTDGIKVTRIETISDGTINTERVGYIDMNVGLEEYKLLKGDILFSNINSVSHIGKTAIAFCDLDLYHGMNLLCIRTRKSFDSFFLFYYLNLESIRCYFKSVCNQAVSQASINQTELAKTILTIPSLSEQQKIAKLLLSIDDKIDYCGKQIVRMESWKKGLLQQMFI